MAKLTFKVTPRDKSSLEFLSQVKACFLDW